jgi:ribose transport system ATP-binding protein
MSGGRIWDEIPQEEFDEQRILAGAFAAHMAAKPTTFHAGAS